MRAHRDLSSSALEARRNIAWGDRSEPQITTDPIVEPAKWPRVVPALGLSQVLVADQKLQLFRRFEGALGD